MPNDKNKQIEALRAKYRPGLVTSEQEKLGSSSMMNMYSKDPPKYRQIYLSKFFMHAGIQKTVMNSPLFVNKFHKPIDILDYLTCNPNWAMCLLDFGFTKTLPSYYAYKVREPLSQLVVEDYFYPDGQDSFASNEV